MQCLHPIAHAGSIRYHVHPSGSKNSKTENRQLIKPLKLFQNLGRTFCQVYQTFQHYGEFASWELLRPDFNKCCLTLSLSLSLSLTLLVTLTLTLILIRVEPTCDLDLDSDSDQSCFSEAVP